MRATRPHRDNMSQVAATTDFDRPPEDAPVEGYVHVGEDLVSQARRWFEDGLHVIDSDEFDLHAEGDTLDGATEQFLNNAQDLLSYLRHIVGEGRATIDENRTFAVLSERFDQIRKRQERELEELTKVRLRLRRRQATVRSFSSTPHDSLVTARD